MDFVTGVGTLVLGFLALMLCVFLFIGIISALFMFFGFVLELVFLPSTLISLLVEFLLVRNTKLEGFGLAGTQVVLVTASVSGIAAGITALCGAALPSILIFAGIGAVYGLIASATAGLGRDFWKPRQ
jgi:hypothetical protein